MFIARASRSCLRLAVRPIGVQSRLFSTSNEPRIAVVLSGCGVNDGTEITEAVSALVHLSRAGASVQCFAPAKNQAHVVDHVAGEVSEGERNVLVESARIARGDVKPLANLAATDFDAVVFPGGFGAGKNLTSFAFDGPDMKVPLFADASLISTQVDGDVESVVSSFHSAKKPIGLCCIAPIIAAKVVPGVEVTMGGEAEEGGKWPFAGATGAVAAWGGKHIATDVDGVHVDKKNKVVTSPAYMCGTATPAQVYDSVGRMVNGVLEALK